MKKKKRKWALALGVAEPPLWPWGLFISMLWRKEWNDFIYRGGKTPFYVHKIKGYVNGHCMGDTSLFHVTVLGYDAAGIFRHGLYSIILRNLKRSSITV